MNIFAWADKKIKTYGIWDIAVLKIYCAAFGIIIGAYFPAFVKQYLVVFIGIILITGTKLIYKMFKP